MARHYWTEAEKAYLVQHYPDTHSEKLALALGVRRSQIYTAAKTLGLKKSTAFLESELSGRTRGAHGVNTRFQAGKKAWNSGQSFDAGGRSVQTRFQAGRKSFNWMPIGSHRINGEGYLERKMTDLPGPNNVRWFPVHRLVWIEAHGEIPPHHLICFKPGMRTNVLEDITIDKIECVSRAEHARRHHPYARGEEFGHLVVLKGAITRRVNKIIQEQREAK